MISKTIGFRGTLFSDTPVYIDDHMANENVWKTFFEELPMGSRLVSGEAAEHSITLEVSLPSGRCEKSLRFLESGTVADLKRGVSENSVPLNPMVLLIIIPIKWL